MGIKQIFFLLPHKNICFGYSGKQTIKALQGILYSNSKCFPTDYILRFCVVLKKKKMYIFQLRYYHDIAQVISCSNHANTALVIGEICLLF